MTPTRWLRICALIAFLFAAGHTLGGQVNWSPMGDNPVLQAMKNTHFALGGVDRTYLDFYRGFGYSISVFQLMLAILLWQLAAVSGSNAKSVRPMIATIASATALCGAISWGFILPLPVVFSAMLFGSLVVAYVLAR